MSYFITPRRKLCSPIEMAIVPPWTGVLYMHKETNHMAETNVGSSKRRGEEVTVA